MLTGSKRMSGITDKDVSFVLELELGGVRFYFGEISQDITNEHGSPTAIRVHGTNLVDSLPKSFDIGSDQAGDNSISISDLRVPVRLPDVFRANAGENMVGCRVVLKLLRDGGDWGEGWEQAVGVITNPVLMSTEAVEDTLSFSIDQESGANADFPSPDYLVGPGWLAEDDEITVAADPEAAFGLDPGDLQIGGIDWSSDNFLFSTANVVLTLPASYSETQHYVPFVFGRPGIAGGDSDVELWKDLDNDGVIDDTGGFSVSLDERLRYFTTFGQVVASCMLQNTSIDDDDVDNEDGGTRLEDIITELGIIGGLGDGSGLDVSELIAGAGTYTFAHQDVCLWARVAIHAGQAAQVGNAIYMVDREHYGTPYSRGGSYTATLGHTANGRPYTYVDIKVDYSAYLELLNPDDYEDNGYEIFIEILDASGDGEATFTILGNTVGTGGNPITVNDAKALWYYAYCCWIGVIRSGGNTGQLLEAFFANPEIQRFIDDWDTSRVWQDHHLSAFNTAMGARQTIKYPTADPLDAHCPGNWTAGGQVFLDDQVVENPAELAMFLFEGAGVRYDRGSWFELRDALRGWQIGGYIDDVTDVIDYVTDALQAYVPFTIGMSSNGLTAKHWKWDALKIDACHHFVEGVDLEVVGDGVVVQETGMLRSLRLPARRVNWLHQESTPYGTFKPVDESQLKEKELKKLERLRGRVGITSGWKKGHAAARRLAKFERHLRSTYGQWDFSQDSQVTEEQAFWRTNNYTGRVEEAAQGKWKENPLTFPVEDSEREQWSRFIPHPLLVGFFRRYEKQDRDDVELELVHVYDTGTIQRAADWMIAARAQPDVRFQGISPKRRGWIIEGDPVRVTAPTFGYVDQLCLVVRKAWQQTNVLWEFRPVRLPGRDTQAVAVAAAVEVLYAEIAVTETDIYRLKLLMNDGDGSTTFIDDGDEGYTISYGTNDGSVDAQTTEQVLFGASSFKSYRGGGTPGHGGRVSSLSWTIGTDWNWAADPDVLMGGPIYPTFTTGDNEQVLLQCATNANNVWIVYYDDAGTLHFRSTEGGSLKCSLDSTIALAFGEWNWWFASFHGGVVKFWVGTHASGFVAVAGSAADTSTYAVGSGGTTGRISAQGAGGGGFNGYMDHIYVREGAYIDDSNGGTTMPVPTAEP